MAIQFESVFWIWLNATSAAVISGDREIAGGQVHLAFGRCGDQIRQFLQGSSIKQQGREWHLPLEPLADLPAFELPIYENANNAQRARECRLPSQAPTSPRAYPLWQRTVVPLERDALPQQFILLMRDSNDHFHARVFSLTQLQLLPSSLSALIYANRQGNQHFASFQGTFDDTATLPQKPKTRAARIKRPNTNTTDAQKWRKLAQRTVEAQARTRKSQIRQIEVRLRDRQTRQNALDCFGERCQVQGCVCTRNLQSALVPLTLEVHHLQAVAAQGDDSLFNLSVICANHHSIFERLQLQVLTESHSDDVILFDDDVAFYLERDLEELRRALKEVTS